MRRVLRRPNDGPDAFVRSSPSQNTVQNPNRSARGREETRLSLSLSLSLSLRLDVRGPGRLFAAANVGTAAAARGGARAPGAAADERKMHEDAFANDERPAGEREREREKEDRETRREGLTRGMICCSPNLRSPAAALPASLGAFSAVAAAGTAAEPIQVALAAAGWKAQLWRTLRVLAVAFIARDGVRFAFRESSLASDSWFLVRTYGKC